MVGPVVGLMVGQVVGLMVRKVVDPLADPLRDPLVDHLVDPLMDLNLLVHLLADLGLLVVIRIARRKCIIILSRNELVVVLATLTLAGMASIAVVLVITATILFSADEL